MSRSILQITKDYIRSLSRSPGDSAETDHVATAELATRDETSLSAPVQQPAVTASSIGDKDIQLFTIVYSEESEARLIPGTLRLDHRHNERSDWREYWPIRCYLTEHTLAEGTLYGFLSPRFPEKTGLSGDDIRRFIGALKSPRPDVVTFSPQADMGAFFLNTLEQGETFDAGFMATLKELVPLLGIEVDLDALVMDSRQVVFSNYFVANKSFWRRWFDVCEKIFALCEARATPLAEALNRQTTYTGDVPRKVFVIERMASLLLVTERWQVAPYSTFKCAWSALPTAIFRDEAIISDALKLALNVTHDPVYYEVFARLRNKIFFPGNTEKGSGTH